MGQEQSYHQEWEQKAGTAAVTDGTGTAVLSAPEKLARTATSTAGTGAAVSPGPEKSAETATATDGTGAAILSVRYK
jgi:hypothetical protein